MSVFRRSTCRTSPVRVFFQGGICSEGVRDNTPAHIKQVFGEERCPKDLSFNFVSTCSAEEWADVFNAFCRISIEDFFRFVIPDLVCDLEHVLQFYRSSLSSNVLLLAHYIIMIRKTLFDVESEKTWTDIKLPEDDDEKRLSRFYAIYKKGESTEYLLTIKQFSKLFEYINIFPLSFDELKIKVVGLKQDALDKLTDILFNKLELSREQMIGLCYRFYLEKKRSITDYVSLLRTELKFFKIRDLPTRKEHLQKAFEILIKLSPADALSLISVRRRAQRKHKTSELVSLDTPDSIEEEPHSRITKKAATKRDYNYAPNDVMLNNSFIFSSFISSMDLPSKDNKRVTILFPSVFFVRKWLSCDLLKTSPVTFVFRNCDVSELIKYHYSAGTYDCCDEFIDVTFTDYSSWLPTKEIQNEHILAFFVGVPIEEQDTIFEALYRHAKDVEISMLLGAHEFETARSPFSASLSAPSFHFTRIDLIPQGINNSAFPRRKIFVHAEINPTFVADDPVSIIPFELNSDYHKQAIARSTDPAIPVDTSNLQGLDTTIRELYNKELLKRVLRGGKRASARSIQFTPDLTIWCSKSYPKNNLGRPRLEAYFSEIPSGEKISRGGKERGIALSETKKHIVKLVNDGDVLYWLSNQYPFSYVRKRRSRKKDKLSTIYTSIRETATTYYREALRGENIALKTLWYLYPDIENYLSERDYKQLCTIVMKTEVGLMRVEDITSDLIEKTLENSFPSDSDSLLFQKFISISRLLDMAAEEGYCNRNPLSDIIKDKKTRDKLFSQVRRALTKKHFTQDEFTAAYNRAAELFACGQMEYIGVIMRLLTGLSSNVICALKWKDIISVSDYGFQKIVVTRQITNDGKTKKGFDSLEDYLCFPCSDLLRMHLQTASEYTKSHYSASENMLEWPVVRTFEKTEHARRVSDAFPPQELDRLCKEMIAFLDLPDRFVSVPSEKDGTKETNLNHYGGDFLRENIRYWTLSYAGMTNDETAYLIGNVPDTTFGRYYCDYLNDASQFLLYVKLLRLDSLLLSGNQKGATYEKHIIIGDYFQKKIGPVSAPMGVQVQVRPSDDASWLEIAANCKYGFSGFISELHKGDA